MITSLVILGSAGAIYGGFGYLAVKYGVDSRNLDGRRNW